MRSKHIIGLCLLTLLLAGAVLAMGMWYHVSYKFILSEKAVLAGQTITLPIDRDKLRAEKEAGLASAAETAVAVPQVMVTPHIAVLLTGLGLDGATTEAAVHLPDAVALGFSPYTVALGGWSSFANRHPILVGVPIAKLGEMQAGKRDLSPMLADDANKGNWEWVLSRLSDYAGIYVHTDEKTLLSLKNIRAFLDSLKVHNLLFVYLGEESNELKELASIISLSMVEGAQPMAADMASDAIAARLSEAEKTAKETGQALLIWHASPAVIQALAGWSSTLEAKGINLVPITDIVRKIE